MEFWFYLTLSVMLWVEFSVIDHFKSSIIALKCLQELKQI